MGFLGRFGGVPTNVGSGGGTHSIAILHSPISVKEAVNKINDTIVNLGYDTLKEIQDEINQKAAQMGLVYTKGPVMTTLRPRIITLKQLEALNQYVKNLWQDLIELERFWLKGGLEPFVQMTGEERELALSQPWNGEPALFASDGLFSFGAQVAEPSQSIPSYYG